jgi:hypothetical protein
MSSTGAATALDPSGKTPGKYQKSQHITLVVFGHSEHPLRGRMPHDLSDQGGFNSTCRVL